MNTLQSLLAEHRIRFAEGGQHRHVREGWIGVDCPWCGGESGKWHLGIHLRTHQASCWRCGPHNLGEILARLLDVSISRAWSLVKELPRTPRIDAERAPAKGRLKTPSGLEPLAEPHQRYLRGRGYDPEQLIRLWGLRAFGLVSQLSWRIWIPVHLDGEIVSWTTRSIGDDPPLRCIHAKPEQEVWPIKTLLYGWDYVRHAVIVCEGPTDVWRIGPGAVATFGLNVTSEQFETILKVPRRIVCFDNEPAAQKTAETLCRKLSDFPGMTMRLTLDASDPGRASDSEVLKIRKLLEE